MISHIRNPNSKGWVENRGDKWTATRKERGMNIFVGSYDFEWEAQIALDIAIADYEETTAYINKKRKELPHIIEAHISDYAKANNISRKPPKGYRPPEAYANAKPIKKK
tara:strand:- start:8765 stop:9091 length:327 start_codon:yes stop_codon:yes gene_type:complete